ncbi:MAG: PD-(D/E)XK nuclease family protein [Proteobacteria bacterium]|nr:PD-(D/E)XK nuclease family protein [Pseudomonadota bacterium]
MNIDEFLRGLHGRLESFQHARELYAPRLAPDFNSFNVISPDEMRLSKILATLLDPAGEHAQGPAFLKAFLHWAQLEGYLAESNPVKVQTEVVTDRIDNPMRRMDIIIDFGDAAIVIENKPWTGDQSEQVSDYVKQVKSSHPNNFCLLYLSGTGEPPTEASVLPTNRAELERKEQLKVKPYSTLLDWLTGCKAVCQSERVRHFLDDFSDYIRQQFMGVHDMTEFNEISNAVRKTKETLRAALKVAANIDGIKIDLLDQLKAQLTDRVQKRSWILDWHIEYWNKYSCFGISFAKEQQQYEVWFEFDGKQCQGLHYGILDKNLLNQEEIRNRLNSNITTGKNGDGWLWRIDGPEPYLYWLNSEEPWMDIICNDKLADMVIEYAEKIYQAL